MARPIDADELKRKMCEMCNYDYADEPCEPSDCVFCRVINETPAITQPNDPLTMVEIRQMHGRPVYVVINDGYWPSEMWALVDSLDPTCVVLTNWVGGK